MVGAKIERNDTCYFQEMELFNTFRKNLKFDTDRVESLVKHAMDLV